MKLDRIQEHLENFRREAGRKWNKLTKQDLESVEADLGSLSEAVAKRYQMSAKQARTEAETFLADFGTTFREAAQMVGEAARDLWNNGRSTLTDAVQNGTEKASGIFAAGRDKASELLDAGRERASELYDASRDQVVALRDRAEKVVVARPLTSIAVAVGVGALLALLFRRR